MAGQPDRVQAALEAARSAGRKVLDEMDSLLIAEALGIETPARALAIPGEPVDLTDVPGRRLVVKVMGAIAHKTEMGGVRIVAREDVGATVDAMRRAFPDSAGLMAAEYVEHGTAPWDEVLLGMRWTDEFGPVVTLGFGGIATEFMGELVPADVFSPALPGAVGSTLDRSVVAGRLTSGFRGGEPPVGRSGLEGLIRRMLALAADSMPGEIAEFEINPLVFRDGRPVALDAVCWSGPAVTAEVRSDLRAGAVAGVLLPESIGIIGVSEGMNLGRVILRNVLGAGFDPAAMVVVKPGADEIGGVRCVPGLGEMGFVDMLVVAVGAGQVPGIVEEVAAGSLARSVVLIPGGLGERKGSEALAGLITEALRSAPHPRPVVNGGNCMGIRSVPGGYDTTFIPAHKLAPEGREGRHPVAVISQSGAFVISRMDRLAWLDPAYLITVGNQIDLTVGDYLDHLADDPGVEVAACYVEGFRPGDGLRWAGAAARMVGRGGRVVLYLGGRTEEGADSAASHTAAVAGDAEVAVALAEAAGALVAGSLEEFEDLVKLATLLSGRLPVGRALGAVSNAGFESVAIADNLGPLELAGLAGGTIERIDAVLAGERLDGVVAAHNPLDLTPNCRAGAYGEAAAAVLADPGVEVGLVGCVPLTPSLETLAAGEGHAEDVAAEDSLARRLIGLWEATDEPWVAVVDAGSLYDPMAGLLEEAGVPVFRSADRALRALGRLV